MTHRPKPPSNEEPPPSSPPDAGGVVRLKARLLGISPMVWQRLVVPGTCTPRELHGVLQVATGWAGLHLYQFRLRAGRYGSRELAASAPDVTLAALHLRPGARFAYEYDLNVPWRHELRLEGHPTAAPGRAYPACTGGSGACPPEDCGGPEGYRRQSLSRGRIGLWRAAPGPDRRRSYTGFQR